MNRRVSHIKCIGASLMSFCCVALLSAGFSSWYGGIGSPIEAEANIAIGDIQELGPFISYDDEMEMFEFCEDGVVDREEEMITSVGDVYMGFSLDASSLKEALKTYYSVESLSSLYITTTLSHAYSLSALFSVYLQSAKLGMSETQVESCDLSPVKDATISSSAYATTFSCDVAFSSAETLYFKAKYSFDFQNEFKSKVYPQLSHDAFTLTFKAEVKL